MQATLGPVPRAPCLRSVCPDSVRYHKNQLKLDRRLCGVAGKTLDYLRQLLSKLNSPKVTQMIWSLSDSFRLTQVHAKPLTVIQLQQESCTLAQIHSASLSFTHALSLRFIQPCSASLSLAQTRSAPMPATVSLRLAPRHSDSLRPSQSHWDSSSSTKIHSVPLKPAQSYSETFGLI